MSWVMSIKYVVVLYFYLFFIYMSSVCDIAYILVVVFLFLFLNKISHVAVCTCWVLGFKKITYMSFLFIIHS